MKSLLVSSINAVVGKDQTTYQITPASGVSLLAVWDVITASTKSSVDMISQSRTDNVLNITVSGVSAVVLTLFDGGSGGSVVEQVFIKPGHTLSFDSF